MIPSRSLPLFAALALTAVPLVRARADMPPPEGYVESCTVEKQSAPGLTCSSCSAWHGDPNACDKTLGEQGMHKMCQSWGASSWSEVWCSGTPTDPKPAESPAPTGGPESPKSGCAAGGDLAPSLLVGLGALSALAAARARRRRV